MSRRLTFALLSALTIAVVAPGFAGYANARMELRDQEVALLRAQLHDASSAVRPCATAIGDD